MKAIRRLTVRTVLPEPLSALTELAMNLRWSWHEPTRALFESIDPEQWDQAHHDPVRLLGSVRTERFAQLAADEHFTARVAAAAEDLRDYLTKPKWYQTLENPPRAIAYFSPEYGLTAVLPQYSGGLGILAGDHLKAASDLGVPIIGVGLLYKRGYFRQSLSRDGWQLETYPLLDPDSLPLTKLRDADGSAVRVTIGLPELRELVAQVWLAKVGRVPLLLLDTDIEENADGGRDVTDRLYGGSPEHRLHQEMLLGIGGIRAVRAYCALTDTPAPEVFHTNEGHAGFLGVERIRELVEDQGLDFDEALAAVRAGTLFTTHTPVPAGIDRFSKDLIAEHFGGENGNPGVPVQRVLALGAETYPGGDPGCFNMAVMGLRLAQRANGVSLLHGEVSREMFGGLWPGFDAPEVPITSITNGVHALTWVHPLVTELIERELGPEAMRSPFEAVGRIPDKTIWEIRNRLRAELVGEARRRVYESWLARGASAAELGWTGSLLDPNALTIGFARRVPSYKRLTLMLRDRERLIRLLTNPDRPVQLVIAGKAHPADDGGKRLVQELVRFADDARVRHRIAFLPNYDMAMAQTLLPGCDVWLNNPLRPLEACGTSGMKAALNGGLNLSIKDGWWDEWYDGENGWAIPTADGVEDPDRRDELEAAALYDLIEHSVARRFYDRDAAGLPTRWIEMVRHTLTTLGPKVLAGRMVQDYVQRLYEPAAHSSRAAAADHYAGSRELAAWTSRVRRLWPQVAIEHVDAEPEDAADGGRRPRLGGGLRIRALVQIGELAPDEVQVQAVFGRVDEDDQLRSSSIATLEHLGVDEIGRNRYEGVINLEQSGPFGYTVRAVPKHRLLSSPAEMGLATLPYSD